MHLILLILNIYYVFQRLIKQDLGKYFSFIFVVIIYYVSAQKLIMYQTFYLHIKPLFSYTVLNVKIFSFISYRRNEE